MKFIRFITFLFYRYYNQGSTKDVAYIKTLCSMMLLIFIHFVIFLHLIGKADLLLTATTGSKGARYLKVAVGTLPIFLFFALFVKERDLRSAEYQERKILLGSRILAAYAVCSFILMIILMFVLSGR